MSARSTTAGRCRKMAPRSKRPSRMRSTSCSAAIPICLGSGAPTRAYMPAGMWPTSRRTAVSRWTGCRSPWARSCPRISPSAAPCRCRTTLTRGLTAPRKSTPIMYTRPRCATRSCRTAPTAIPIRWTRRACRKARSSLWASMTLTPCARWARRSSRPCAPFSGARWTRTPTASSASACAAMDSCTIWCAPSRARWSMSAAAS